MKNNDDIPTTDTTEIKQLINRVKQGELDQGDALLIEKLLNLLLTIASLLQRKNISIRRMKELLLGTKEKKQRKEEAKDPADGRKSGSEESSRTDSSKGASSNSVCGEPSASRDRMGIAIALTCRRFTAIRLTIAS
jgi:hypothetical protein